MSALILSVMAWAALLGVGLEGAASAVHKTLAGKFAGHAQPVQRQAASSLVTRERRFADAHVNGTRICAETEKAIPVASCGVLPAVQRSQGLYAQRADAPPTPARPWLPPLKCAHHCRAPPVWA